MREQQELFRALSGIKNDRTREWIDRLFNRNRKVKGWYGRLRRITGFEIEQHCDELEKRLRLLGVSDPKASYIDEWINYVRDNNRAPLRVPQVLAVAALANYYERTYSPSESGGGIASSEKNEEGFTNIYERWARQEHTKASEQYLAKKIRSGDYHIFRFDNSAYEAASRCIEPLEFIPYSVSIVEIRKKDKVVGVAGFEFDGMLLTTTIGGGADRALGRQLLAYISNCTSARVIGDAVDYYSLPTRKYVGKKPAKESNDAVVFVGNQRPVTRVSRGGTHASPTKAHIRRAHTRRQHYGPGNSLVKTIVIQQTVVSGGMRGKPSKYGGYVHRVRLAK